MDTIIILIKLIVAHLLGDFIFQTDEMARNKRSPIPSQKFTTLAVHSLVQATLSYLLIAQWSNWIIPVIIAVSHFIIDCAKSLTAKDNLKTFIIDQTCHYAVILALWWVYYIVYQSQVPVSSYIFSLKFWLVATTFIAVLKPTSILLKLFLENEKWIPNNDTFSGLPNAGKWIGYLERILILTFIYTGNVMGVGFLLAAKSIFRFGELNRTKDIKTTEYVLIGTFSSFTIAILLAFVAQWLHGNACC